MSKLRQVDLFYITVVLLKANRAVPPQYFHSSSPIRCEILKKMRTHNGHPPSEQNAEIDSLISGHFAFVVVFKVHVALRTL